MLPCIYSINEEDLMVKNYVPAPAKPREAYSIKANNPLDFVEKFMMRCKDIDPGLKNIKISMKGTDFDREIARTF
jgi:hypothetical protein